MSRLDEALTLAERGYYVGPVKPRSKEPLFIQGLFEHGYKSATRDSDTIRAIWTRCPDAGIFIDCGRSGVLVVDCDSNEADVEAHRNGLPSTVERHSRYVAYIYHRPENCPTLRTTHRGRSGKIDILTDGLLVVANTHEEGHSVFLSELLAAEDLTVAPAWAVNLAALTATEVAELDVPDLTDLDDSPDLDTLNLEPYIVELITNGSTNGERSEALWNVVRVLLHRHELDERTVASIVWHHPIGEKAREHGRKWLAADIARAKSKKWREGPTFTFKEDQDEPGPVAAMGPEPATEDILAELENERAKSARWRERALAAERQYREATQRHSTIMRVLREPGYTAVQRLARVAIVFASHWKQETATDEEDRPNEVNLTRTANEFGVSPASLSRETEKMATEGLISKRVGCKTVVRDVIDPTTGAPLVNTQTGEIRQEQVEVKYVEITPACEAAIETLNRVIAVAPPKITKKREPKQREHASHLNHEELIDQATDCDICRSELERAAIAVSPIFHREISKPREWAKQAVSSPVSSLQVEISPGDRDGPDDFGWYGAPAV